MSAAIAVVTALAWWDAQREDRAALDDLGQEQSVLASILARVLAAKLPGTTEATAASRAATLFESAADVERPGELLVFLADPDGPDFYGADGRRVVSPALRDAFDRGATVTTLSRVEAAAVGLRERTAVAGFARLAWPAARWGVAAVATAARERDRQRRARARLVLGVIVAAGLVLAFGGVALARQRSELELERELALSEARRERDRKLSEAQRVAAMGTFAMGIVHEVSTPLGVIVGRAEQLRDRFRDDDRAARATEAILQQADRIHTTVRRFLDLARGGPPSLGQALPGDLVRSAASAVEHRFVGANVRLEIDLPDGMRPVPCDRALLEHAIVNLLLNACHACEPGGKVEVSAREEAGRVVFVVADDGVGIRPEHVARAAEPFFTTKPAGQGTGLGLALASEIVKGHQGVLSIAPHPPRGTRATIEIPASAPVGPPRS
ncbi:MAG TPA: HAMP domain-containing sensor histidine kinase [Polyangiaceae bacterium]|nr:HAMP domain-containing sensor histidine kinase [Polyangiaceae bacterium]